MEQDAVIAGNAEGSLGEPGANEAIPLTTGKNCTKFFFNRFYAQHSLLLRE